MDPIKHFYYYCDLADLLGAAIFCGMAAFKVVSSITPIVKTLQAAW